MTSWIVRLHTLAAYLLVRFGAVLGCAPLVILVAVLIGALLALMAGSVNPWLVGVLFFIGYLALLQVLIRAARLLYRFAALRDECTYLHGVMKQFYRIQGPNGRYLRPLPNGPLHVAGLTITPPPRDGWVTTMASQYRGQPALKFAWLPLKAGQRTAWLSSTRSIEFTVGQYRNQSSNLAMEIQLQGLVEALERSWLDTERVKVELKAVDFDVVQNSTKWRIDYRHKLRTISRGRGVQYLVSQDVSVFPAPNQNGRVLTVAAYARMPIEEQFTRQAEELMTLMQEVRTSLDRMGSQSPPGERIEALSPA